MVHIVTNTGETEGRNGAKGYVFLQDPLTKREAYIFFCPAIASLDDENPWQDKWRKQIYDVPNGAVIKLGGGSTFRGVPHKYGNAYFLVLEGLPIVKASCEGYNGNYAYIIGPLKRIAYEEIEAKLGIKLKGQHKKYYRNDTITVEATEEPIALGE